MEEAKIVLVDFDERDRRSTCAVLELAGHEVTAQAQDTTQLVDTVRKVINNEIDVDVFVCNKTDISDRAARVLRAFGSVARYETSLLGFDWSPESTDRDIFSVLADIEQM